MRVATEHTYTLSDLERWPASVEHWPASGVPLAVVGSPVSHSLSPAMHNSALAELARAHPRFATWTYFKFDVPPDRFEYALALFHRHRFRGLNLTVPHKALVVPRLATRSAFVQDAGAANTLQTSLMGWDGHNTDGAGLAAALKEDLGVDLKGSNVILLGAGGAARAAAIQCLQSKCASLWIGNRTAATLEVLLAALRASKAAVGKSPLQGFNPAQPPAELPAGSVVINATSLGLKPEDKSPLDLTRIPRPAQVYDMIYRPPHTALLREAATLGIPYANGLSMLVHQGVRSLEIWTGEPAPVAVMQAAVRAAMSSL